MDPIDEELKRGLSNGPLSSHGFSDKLKKRIGERAEEQEKSPAKWMPIFGGISAVVIAAAVFFTSDWPRLFSKAVYTHEQTAVGENAALPLAPSVHQALTIRSAVLIGLREDHSAKGSRPSYSTYRTLMLAAEQGGLRKIAEGDGILMPYKTDFMRIHTQNWASSNDEFHTLNAFLSREGISKPALTEVPKQSTKLSEKLLFAGNRYLAIAQTFRESNQGSDQQYEYVWVKELQDLFQPKMQLKVSPTQAPHVSLSKLYGEKVRTSLRDAKAEAPQEPGAPVINAQGIDANGESWTIARKKGEWVPQLASYRSRTDQGSYRYELRDVPLKLPDSVVAYDRLAVGWNEIRRVRPDAKDAFSSPNEEMLGIITDKEIIVYPLQGQLIPTPLLSLGLSPDESIVMIQWAVNEPYVENWKQKGRELLAD